MKHILAFAGSNSSTSINHQLVQCASTLITECTIEVISLSAYTIPMYSEDEEKKGFPKDVQTLLQNIKAADAILISVNEHNGSWSAFFKNIIDWLSRVERTFLAEKEVFLMSTSPGKRGGMGALAYAEDVLPRFGAKIITTYSLPSFYEHFSTEDQTISDTNLFLQLKDAMSTFVDQLK